MVTKLLNDGESEGSPVMNDFPPGTTPGAQWMVKLVLNGWLMMVKLDDG